MGAQGCLQRACGGDQRTKSGYFPDTIPVLRSPGDGFPVDTRGCAVLLKGTGTPALSLPLQLPGYRPRVTSNPSSLSWGNRGDGGESCKDGEVKGRLPAGAGRKDQSWSCKGGHRG